MNRLPNILTVSRIVLTVFFIFFFTQGGFISMVLAAIAFALASITDYYDGYLAKKYNLITDFGKIMDPIADKFLILAAFFIFAKMNIVPLWMFLIIFVREVVVTSSRLFAVRKGKVIAAEKAGKYKTVSQILAIAIILIFMIFKESSLSASWSQDTFIAWQSTITVCMLIAVILTLFSGIAYFWNNRKLNYV